MVYSHFAQGFLEIFDLYDGLRKGKKVERCFIRLSSYYEQASSIVGTSNSNSVVWQLFLDT